MRENVEKNIENQNDEIEQNIEFGLIGIQRKWVNVLLKETVPK